MTTTIYQVRGMTCGHCVAAVHDELVQVDGVTSVEVDLAGGQAVVVGDAVSDLAVRAAVEEAGYEVVP